MRAKFFLIGGLLMEIEDFTWEVVNGRATILKYKFSHDQVVDDIVIPTFIAGFPVTKIAGLAFRGNKLRVVVIPNGVTTIEDEAFAWNRLTHITIPASITIIGDGAFGNNLLEEVNVPEGVKYIGENAFIENRLRKVGLPSTVRRIGEGAFDGNDLLSKNITRGRENDGKQ